MMHPPNLLLSYCNVQLGRKDDGASLGGLTDERMGEPKTNVQRREQSGALSRENVGGDQTIGGSIYDVKT